MLQAHIRIEFPRDNIVRAVHYDTDGRTIKNIFETNASDTVLEVVTELGLPVYHKDVALMQGELSLAEELEALRG